MTYLNPGETALSSETSKHVVIVNGVIIIWATPASAIWKLFGPDFFIYSKNLSLWLRYLSYRACAVEKSVVKVGSIHLTARSAEGINEWRTKTYLRDVILSANSVCAKKEITCDRYLFPRILAMTLQSSTITVGFEGFLPIALFKSVELADKTILDMKYELLFLYKFCPKLFILRRHIISELTLRRSQKLVRDSFSRKVLKFIWPTLKLKWLDNVFVKFSTRTVNFLKILWSVLHFLHAYMHVDVEKHSNRRFWEIWTCLEMSAAACRKIVVVHLW